MDTAGHERERGELLTMFYHFNDLLYLFKKYVEQWNCIQMKEFASVIVAVCSMLYCSMLLCISTNMTFSSVK